MRTLAISLALLAATVNAENPFGVPPSPEWNRLQWLTGCWQGTGLGGEITECWVASDDGHYTSVFQLEHRGSLSFTEIVALADFNGSPAMRVRHFNPDFSQWDSDKGSYISFPLLAIDRDRVSFEGLEYRLKDGELHISLDMGQADGSVSTQRFTLKRLGPVQPGNSKGQTSSP
jgi:hypothetical protein